MDEMTTAGYAPIWSVVRRSDGSLAIIVVHQGGTVTIEKPGIKYEDIPASEEVEIVKYPSELARDWLNK